MKSMTKITITVMVSDLTKALHFYIDTLGLSLLKRYGDFYAEIEGPGLTIGLHPTEIPSMETKNISIGFGVSEFDKEVNILTEKGIKVSVKQDGPVRLGHFSDPDQNQLYLADIASYEAINL